MPALGPVTLVEAVWTAAFLAALVLSVQVHGPVLAVRRDRMRQGYDSPLDLFFVRLTWLLVTGSVAGFLFGLYASALPAGGAPVGTPLRAMSGVIVGVLLLVIAAALVLIAVALRQAHRQIARPSVGARDSVAVVSRRLGGQRAYDLRPDEKTEAP